MWVRATRSSTRWRPATGKLAWKYETGDKILGAPNWVKSGSATRVLAGSYDFKLHCVDAGDRPQQLGL